MRVFQMSSLVVIVAIVLTACSGGGATPSTTIKVEMTDFQFTPNKFVVPAGQTITITVTNAGSVVHDFIIMKLGADVGDDYGPEDAPNVFWQAQIQPGESSTETFTAPAEPGEYQVVCGTPGHFKAGMIAALIVAAP